jgi:hypothetical protein
MQIKLQPATIILSQESIHTMLSITHHSQERPSTGLGRSDPQKYLSKFLSKLQEYVFIKIT